MDASHEAQLQRILENRKSRGSLRSAAPAAPPSAASEGYVAAPVDAPTTTAPSPVSIQHNSPQRVQSARATFVNSASAATTTAPAFSFSAASATTNSARSTGNFYLNPRTNPSSSNGAPPPMQQQQPQPVSSTSFYGRVSPPRPSAAPLPSFLTANSAGNTDKLREAQALQERKVDQLQDELRKGLNEIREALHVVIEEQRQAPAAFPIANTPTASNKSRNSAAHRVLSGFASVKDPQNPGGNNGNNNHLVTTPIASRKTFKSGQETTIIRTTTGAAEGSQSDPMSRVTSTTAALQMPNTTVKNNHTAPLWGGIIPGGVQYPQLTGTSQYDTMLQKQSVLQHDQHHRYKGTVVDGPVGGSGGANRVPTQPPLVARPFSRSTIDVQSALTILKEGDWWYKWSSSGHSVKLRWIWMDPTRRAICWSPKQIPGEAPMFGARIPIEEMLRVTTTQIQEQDPHGNPRIFYVLLVECSARMLQIGTERRDKFDVWYDAINSVIMGVQQAIQSQILDALSTD